MSALFTFKQFTVDQSGCAMKINTDGALLGALAYADQPRRILDIGTGTGVIALMLAQRFPGAQTHAVEIDPQAAAAARANFCSSPFSARLQVFGASFQDYFKLHKPAPYDLIVSNPPFFIGSLRNPDLRKGLARHAAEGFFAELVAAAAMHLSERGLLALILPPETAAIVTSMAQARGLHLHEDVAILSFAGDKPHRRLLTLGRAENECEHCQFIIYQAQKEYSAAYREALKDFFTIF